MHNQEKEITLNLEPIPKSKGNKQSKAKKYAMKGQIRENKIKLTPNYTRKIIVKFCINSTEELELPLHSKILIIRFKSSNRLAAYIPGMDTLIELKYNPLMEYMELKFPILTYMGLYISNKSGIYQTKFRGIYEGLDFKPVASFSYDNLVSMVSPSYDSNLLLYIPSSLYTLIDYDDELDIFKTEYPLYELFKFNTLSNTFSKISEISINYLSEFSMCCLNGKYVYVFTSNQIFKCSILIPAPSQIITLLDNVISIDAIYKPTALIAQISKDQLLIAGGKKFTLSSVPHSYIFDTRKLVISQAKDIDSISGKERFTGKGHIIWRRKVISSTCYHWNIIKYSIENNEWKIYWDKNQMNIYNITNKLEITNSQIQY